MKRLAKWLMAGVLAAGCGGSFGPSARHPGYGGPGYGSPAYAHDDNAFYDELSQYGRWIDHPRYGSVWVPEARDFEPYRDGYWVNTDQGLTWVSDAPFGWAAEHYGRWVREPQLGWAWIPGDEWGPGWVEWYDAGDAVGWAPLGPDGRPWQDAYRYVPHDRLGQRDMNRHYVSGRDRGDRGRRIDRPDRDWFERRNVPVQPPQQVDQRRIDDERRRQIEAQRRDADEWRQEEDARRRAEDEQRRQQQYVNQREEAERLRAEQQRAAEEQARAREEQQRAIEEAERRRAEQRGIDDAAAARLRREAQGDRREEQQQRRSEQQQRRDEAAARRQDQLQRRGGYGADPAADRRDAERAQRDAEADRADREREQRDRERDARDAERNQQRQNVSGGGSASQSSAERDALLRHLSELSARELRDLERSNGSARARQELLRKQQDRQQQRLHELEQKQRSRGR